MADEQLGTIRIVTEAAERQVEKAYKEAGQAAGRASGNTFGDAVRNKIVGLARRFGGSSGGELASAAIGRFSRSAAAAPGDRGSPVQSAVTGATAGRLAARGGAQAQASAAGGLAARGGAAAAGGLSTAGAAAGFAAVPIATVVAFGTALKKAADIANRWAETLDRNSERFARVNAGFAVVRAQAQIRQLRRDIVASGELSGVFAAREGTRQRLQDATLGARIRRQEVGAFFDTFSDTFSAGMEQLFDKVIVGPIHGVIRQPKWAGIMNAALAFMNDKLDLIFDSSDKIEKQLTRESIDEMNERTNEKMTREIRELSGMMGQPDDPFFQGNP